MLLITLSTYTLHQVQAPSNSPAYQVETMAFLTRFWKSSNELKKDEFRRKLDLAEPQPDDTCVVCYDEDEPTVRTCISPCTHAVCLTCLDSGLLAYNVNICPICQTLWYGKWPKRFIEERIMDFSDAHPTVERIIFYLYNWGNLTFFIFSLFTLAVFYTTVPQGSRGLLTGALYMVVLSAKMCWTQYQILQRRWPILYEVDTWLSKRIWRWILATLCIAFANAVYSRNDGERTRRDLRIELETLLHAMFFCCTMLVRNHWPDNRTIQMLFPPGY